MPVARLTGTGYPAPGSRPLSAGRARGLELQGTTIVGAVGGLAGVAVDALSPILALRRGAAVA